MVLVKTSCVWVCVCVCVCVWGGGGLSLAGSQTSFWAMEFGHFLTGFVFLVHIQENLEDELVKEALEKVGNNALGADL